LILSVVYALKINVERLINTDRSYRDGVGDSRSSRSSSGSSTSFKLDSS
jgi:hypothetical protein